MTSFQDDDGNFLDYSGDDFVITKQSLSVSNFKITGDKSSGFNLKNTSPIRKALGVDGLNQISSPALSKSPWKLIRNGNLTSSGFIVINRINRTELECYFIAGNSNWFTDFGFNIQEVNYNDFADTTAFWAYTYINSRISATEGIVFPFVDWVYNRQKNGDIFSVVIYSGDANDAEGVYSDFYPCFYLKSLMSYVFRHAGYSLGGDILTDQLYNSTIVTPDSGDLSYPQGFIDARKVTAYITATQSITGGVLTTINLVTLTDENNFNNTNHTYIDDGNYTIIVRVNIIVSVSQAYTLFINRAGVASVLIPTSTVATGTTIIGSAEYPYPIGREVYITISGLAGFDITSGAISFEIKKTIKPPNYLSTGGSYLNPIAIIPSLQAVDLVKAVAIRYGCVVTYNEYSKTISLNKIDRITDVEDWSDYLLSYEIIYEKGFKNNYIRMEQADEFESYDKLNTTGFGEGNLETDFEVNQDNDLYTDPFPGALDSIMPAQMAWTQPYVPLVLLEDGEAFTVSSISNSGFGGLAQLNGTGFDITVNTVIRFIDNTGFYTGYHKVQAATSTAIIINTSFVATSSGTMYAQSTSLNEGAKSRLLINTPSYSLSNLSIYTFFTLDTTGDYSAPTSIFTWPYAYFSKPTTLANVDRLRASLSYDKPNIPGYNDVPLTENYTIVKNMLSGPILRAQMLLPEAVVNTFNSDKFIRLTGKDFTGVFWVERINNYKDARTPVEVDFLNAYKNG